MLTKIGLSQNSRKTSESYKTRKNAFDKTHYFSGILGEFLDNFRENHKKTLGKRFWTNFEKNNFSENYQRILGECSQARSVLQNLRLSISRDGPCIRLINSKYWTTYFASDDITFFNRRLRKRWGPGVV